VGDTTEDHVAVQVLRESERDLKLERQWPVRLQVVAGPRNHWRRGVSGRKSR